jgi:hypothetical protein
VTRRSTKLVAGAAAAGLLPFLLGQSPAAAAFATESDARTVSFTANSGETVTCNIFAAHRVDTESALEIEFFMSGDPCRGGLNVAFQYVDDGETRFGGTFAANTTGYSASIPGAETTAVTVDYTLTFSNCSANCSHTFQTKTK